MIINGKEINYIDAQLKMAAVAWENYDLYAAEHHFALAEEADTILQTEIAEWDAFVASHEVAMEEVIEVVNAS